jgi:hypothetical protein
MHVSAILHELFIKSATLFAEMAVSGEDQDHISFAARPIDGLPIELGSSSDKPRLLF